MNQTRNDYYDDRDCYLKAKEGDFKNMFKGSTRELNALYDLYYGRSKNYIKYEALDKFIKYINKDEAVASYEINDDDVLIIRIDRYGVRLRIDINITKKDEKSFYYKEGDFQTRELTEAESKKLVIALYERSCKAIAEKNSEEKKVPASQEKKVLTPGNE